MPHQLDAELFDAKRFDTNLQSSEAPLSLFRDALIKANQVLADRFHQGRAATELVYARAALIDALITRAWALFLPMTSPDISLVAVGGYGRGELHPASDIDVMILLQNNDAPFREGITNFLTFLWDMGLEVGHSVRSMAECHTMARDDITIATNIQESRLLVGDQEQFEAEQHQCATDKIWPGPTFFRAKLDEQKLRHQRYHETAYRLEPNIKESPGGLRDIQVIGWVAKRHYGVNTLHELVDHGFLTEDEYRQLHEGQAFLWRVRFGLHLLAGRREDRLLFDYQRELARQFGYRDNPHRLAVEQFMKQYYRTVMELSRLNEMLLQLFQEEILYADDPAEPIEINKRFVARRGYLEVQNENTFRHYPFGLLEVFLLLEQHPELKGVRANTIRLIRRDRNLIDSTFRSDLRNRSLFMEILRQTTGVTHELRRMNRYGILAAYLPEFGRIVGQMQHDLFHVYTVDEHILMVVRNLRRFTVPEFYSEFPFLSELIQRIPKQELLLIAALYHDIGKGRGGDHSELGAIDAQEFCQRHGLSEYDTNLVIWLIRNHLVMSDIAQRKDIDDPDVVHEFAVQVGDLNRLNYLYLLTVADIRGTSDSVWNSWKATLLRELYDATRTALRRGLHNPVLQSETRAETRRLATQDLIEEGFDMARVTALWDTIGEEYFLRFRPEEIVWHTGAILSRKNPDQPVVMIRDMPRRGGTEVFTYSPSHPALLLQATSVLERNGISIMDARIFNTDDGNVLDSFLVVDHDGHPLGEGEQTRGLQDQLLDALTQPEEEAPTITARLSRQRMQFTFPTSVEFEQDETSNSTMMLVKTYDRPGLLSRIAQALQERKIQLRNARIATFGERAEDIFYLVGPGNQSLNDPAALQQLEQTITAYLED
jgi:[protein-PII] uridylyltransferase